MKINNLLQEAPLDFVRGAASSIGQAVGRTAPVRGIRNVIGAGQAASQAADARRNLQKLVTQFVQQAHLVLKQTPPQAQPATPQPAPQQPAQQPQPQQRPRQPAPGSAVPAAFRTTQKPKYVSTPHGPSLQFSSFLAEPTGEQLDEAWRDFIKGASKQAAQDVSARTNAYWKSVLGNKVGGLVRNAAGVAGNALQAGANASIEADTARALEDQRLAYERMNKLAVQIKQLVNNNPQLWQLVVQTIQQSHKNPADPRVTQVIELLKKARG